jgi:hypothetical protein
MKMSNLTDSTDSFIVTIIEVEFKRLQNSMGTAVGKVSASGANSLNF